MLLFSYECDTRTELFMVTLKQNCNTFQYDFCAKCKAGHETVSLSTHTYWSLITYYCSGKSLAGIVDCSAQTLNWCSEGEKGKNTQERLFEKKKTQTQNTPVNNFPMYKTKMNQHPSTEHSFSDLKWKNTMTCARTFGVQKAAYILQKKNFFFSSSQLWRQLYHAVLNWTLRWLWMLSFLHLGPQRKKSL